MSIVVNIDGRDVHVVDPVLSYDAVVRLAGETGQPSVTYKGIYPQAYSGILAPGDRIAVQFGLSFRVCHTGNA